MSVAAAPRLLDVGRWAPALAPLVAAAFVLALYTDSVPLVAAAVLGPPVLVAIAVRPEWGLALVLAAAPFISVAVPVGPEGTVRLLRVALPLLALWSIAQGITLKPRRVDRVARPHLALVLAVLAALATMALSGMLAVEPVGALRFIPEFCTAVLAFFAAAQVAHRPHGTERVLLGAMTGLLAVGAYGVVQAVSGAASGGSFYVNGDVVNRVQASFPHPNFYATYLAVLIPVGAAVALSKSFRPGLRAVAALAGAVGAAALVVTYSRGPAIGLIAGGVAWLLLVRPRQTIAGAAVLAVLVVAVAPSQITERFAGVGVTGDVALRSSIWRGALDIFSQHPVAGAGINNFPFAYARTSGIEAPASHHPAISQVGGDELPPTAHNAYLNVAAEQGTLGLIVYLALGAVVLVTLRRALRARDGRTRALGAGVGIAVAAWAVAGVVDTIPFGEAAIALFAVIGLAASSVAARQEGVSAIT